MYEYRIKEVIKVVDGDTLDVVLDLGFHTYVQKRIRLYGINTPETRTSDKEEKKKGLAAKARLKELLNATPVSTEELYRGLIVRSHGLGKYGRVLGEVLKDNLVLNRVLVKEGHACEYHV